MGTRPGSFAKQYVLLATKQVIQPKLIFCKSIFYCNSYILERNRFQTEWRRDHQAGRFYYTDNTYRVLNASFSLPGRRVFPCESREQEVYCWV